MSLGKIFENGVRIGSRGILGECIKKLVRPINFWKITSRSKFDIGLAALLGRF